MGNITSQNRSETKTAKNTRAKDFSTRSIAKTRTRQCTAARTSRGRKGGCSLLWCARRTAWGGRSRPRRRARSAPRGGTRAVVVVRGGLDEVLVVRGGGDGRRARGRGRPPLRGILHVGGGGRRAPSRGGAHRLRRRARSRVRSRCGGIRSSRHLSRSRARDALRRTSRRASGDRRPGRRRVSRGPR